MQVYGVIMAGGNGTRFWPLSRKSNPKQLLNLSGKDYMINETIKRLLKVVSNKNLFIITNEKQAKKTTELTKPYVDISNIVSEPVARNTSACICYSALKLYKTYGDGVMVITPSDAFIKNEEEFARILNVAISHAESSDDLVTIGIKPTFASTGYGYIEYTETNSEVKEVKQFVEKPDSDLAKKYLESGKFLWNSGMFIWKTSVILDKFKSLVPDVYNNLMEIYDYIGTEKEYSYISKVYPELESISVDYGVMEKSDKIKVVPAEFGWSDVGSFDTIDVLHKSDENGNISEGDNIMIDCKNSTVFTANKTVALIGVSDLVVVETPDALLVCKKTNSQDIKKVVAELEKRGRNDLL
ncbi:MAG: mannose-1-phosphate guanylyltransferase [Clostridia bacterium]|nr:mannose-1-phosphate guanylyltransferase [Clostridia bacterium]